jgi:hypothetical protein
MKRFLCRLLRSLLHRLGDDVEREEMRLRLLAKMYGIAAANGGTRESLESAIRCSTPAGMAPEFTWDSPLMKGDRLKLTVVWR